MNRTPRSWNGTLGGILMVAGIAAGMALAEAPAAPTPPAQPSEGADAAKAKDPSPKSESQNSPKQVDTVQVLSPEAKTAKRIWEQSEFVIRDQHLVELRVVTDPTHAYVWKGFAPLRSYKELDQILNSLRPTSEAKVSARNGLLAEGIRAEAAKGVLNARFNWVRDSLKKELSRQEGGIERLARAKKDALSKPGLDSLTKTRLEKEIGDLSKNSVAAQEEFGKKLALAKADRDRKEDSLDYLVKESKANADIALKDIEAGDIPLSALLSASKERVDAAYGGAIFTEAIYKLKKDSLWARFAVNRDTGINAASVRVYSDLIGLRGKQEGTLLQIDARMDFNFPGIYGYLDRGRFTYEEGSRFILLQRASLVAFFPSMLDQGEALDSTNLRDPIYRYRAAIGRVGGDLNLISVYAENHKMRLNTMAGLVCNAVDSSAHQGKYSNGVYIKPYLRYVNYFDRALDIDLRLEHDFLWVPENEWNQFSGASVTLQMKDRTLPFSAMFLKLGAQAQWERFGNSLRPSAEIGYRFQQGIASKISSAIKVLE